MMSQFLCQYLKLRQILKRNHFTNKGIESDNRLEYLKTTFQF